MEEKRCLKTAKREEIMKQGSQASPHIAILNDSTRYQEEPGKADPEEEPRL
jgi:hypothetical protein